MESLHNEIVAKGISVEDDALPWLEKLNERGELSLGWPVNGGQEGIPERAAERADDRADDQRSSSGNVNESGHLLPHSFVWFPKGRPSASSTSIVSSRLGRQVDSLDKIFQVLRSALAQLDPQRQVVLSVEGTTTHPFVVRGCELFGIPLLKVFTASPRTSLKKWAMASLRTAEEEPTSIACFVSHPTNVETSSPIRDQIAVLGSDQLLALSVRRDGNLHQLLLKRLERASASRVFLALGHPQLVSQAIATELMDAGAIGWLLMAGEDRIGPCPMDTMTVIPSAPVISKGDVGNQERYLTHCTRRARGAWPDQLQDDYLDELILGEATRDRSSFAALMRIVRMQRLLASGESIRDSTPVVSLTSARLDELSSMHTFRAHRGRWDFEPYGVSIARNSLNSFGARQVIYGDEADWSGLSQQDRPYFQKLNAQSGIDWSIEKEWRVIGDIDLSQISREDAFVFVPTETEAQHLASVSRWPVVVIESD